MRSSGNEQIKAAVNPSEILLVVDARLAKMPSMWLSPSIPGWNWAVLSSPSSMAMLGVEQPIGKSCYRKPIKYIESAKRWMA